MKRLTDLARWWDRRQRFVPASWACHELGISKAALSRAKDRYEKMTGQRVVRSEVLRLADGFEVELVSIDDVARMKPHGGEYVREEPVEPRIPHPQEIGETLTAAKLIQAGHTEDLHAPAPAPGKPPRRLRPRPAKAGGRPAVPPPKRGPQKGFKRPGSKKPVRSAPNRGGGGAGKRARKKTRRGRVR